MHYHNYVSIFMFSDEQPGLIFNRIGKYITKHGTLKLQVVHAGSGLPIFHPEIQGTNNIKKSPHNIKESIYIV